MESPSPDIDDVLRQLRATVADRRARGEYPEGLEDDLDAHFRRILAARPGLPRLAMLRRRVDAARQASRFSPQRIPASSRIPGGTAVHRGLGKLFYRQAVGILQQVQEFADRTLEALDAAVGVLERPDAHRHDDLVEMVDVHSELLAARYRTPTGPDERLEDLLSRVETLEAAEASRRWQPWFSRQRFEAAFGDGGVDRARRLAAAALGDRDPVLDLGAAGADPLDALDAVEDREAAGLAGIVLLGAEDRVRATDLVDLIAVAAAKLGAGGRLVVSCGPVALEGAPADAVDGPRFDPSLGPPLPADYAVFACREAGFRSVDAERWPGGGYLIVAAR